MTFSTPDQIFEELFTDLHQSGLWADGKVISDAQPKAAPEEILSAYRKEKGSSDFDLKTFFDTYFTPSASPSTGFESDTSRPVDQHIRMLWDVLTRKADRPVKGSSLIPLPHPYVVPGGRFNEIYYWDSYFTMLGLQASGRTDLITHMIDNFSWLIEQIGFIPNGNRTYFLGRSQPPFYSLMVRLLAEDKGEEVLSRYLPYLLREHQFWTAGQEELQAPGMAVRRMVRLEEDHLLNRYYDDIHEPRAEMFSTDLEALQESGREATTFFLDVRAACESGWDFSARWFEDESELGTIQTTKLLPVDLNCLMVHLEQMIARVAELTGNQEQATDFRQKADTRAEAIRSLFWNGASGYFYDYQFVKEELSDKLTLAGMFPLFFKIATPDQAATCARTLESHFLADGGLLTTPMHTGQQWDAPNGWAPLQWISIKGLKNYGFDQLAQTISDRWVRLNENVYKRTGKLMEKYNVEDTSLLSGGGEYPVQDGFGWTNGVLLKLLSQEQDRRG